MEDSEFDYEEDLNSTEPEDLQWEYETGDAKAKEEFFQEFMNQPITRDYGPPARQKLTSFDAPDENANPPESKQQSNPPTPKPRPKPKPKPIPRSTKKVEKAKADQPGTPATAAASPSTSTAEPTKTKTNKEPTVTATTKRKLPTNSTPVNIKKTKDANTGSVTKVIINGKTCVQRNLDFSAGQSTSRIPVGSQVRVGRSSGNPRTQPESGPRPRSRSRQRGCASAEGRGRDSR